MVVETRTLSFENTYIAPSFVAVTSQPEVGGNKISRAQAITNIFITFATAAFATSGQSFVRLKIALDMAQGCKLP